MLYIRLNLYLLVRWACAIVRCQYVGQGIKILSGKYLLTQWIGHILMFFFYITKQSKSFFFFHLACVVLLDANSLLLVVFFKHAVMVTSANCASWQMNQRETDVKSRVRAVAFTDSAHNIWHQDTSKGAQDWMQQVKKNFFKKHSHQCTEMFTAMLVLPEAS